MESGIYRIRNTTTNDFYIGSAIKFNGRFNKHKSALKSQKHENSILQRVYNKYGLEKLVFEVVEVVENKNDLISREQYYLDTLKPRYNICKIAGSSLGIKRSNTFRKKMSEVRKGKKASLEARVKMSEAAKKRKASAETKVKMSILRKGKKHTEIHVTKIAEANSKPFKFISPESVIVEGKNLVKFCREHGLNRRALWLVLHNKRKSHKGWTAIKNPD